MTTEWSHICRICIIKKSTTPEGVAYKFIHNCRLYATRAGVSFNYELLITNYEKLKHIF
jgi:hypothetical protein